MEKKSDVKLEVEISEHSDADFIPEKCLFCDSEEINRKTYKIRIILDVGMLTLCRRIRYEKVRFNCKKCSNKTFTNKHSLIPP